MKTERDEGVETYYKEEEEERKIKQHNQKISTIFMAIFIMLIAKRVLEVFDFLFPRNFHRSSRDDVIDMCLM